MKTTALSSLLILALILCFGIDSEARRYKKIELSPQVVKDLNSVLSGAAGLHRALIEADHKASHEKINEIIAAVDDAKLASHSSAYGLHLQKVLSAMKTYLLSSYNQSDASKKQALARAFREVVQLARTYKLKPYTIFFCPKDRSEWIQDGRKAENPLYSDVHCGVPVS